MSLSPTETSTEGPAGGESHLRARRMVELGVLAARAFNRPDLEASLEAALAHIDRPQTLIAVIGEFKQGKSSLVNALLGFDAAVVDDDLATAALTLFAYAESPTAVVSLVDAGEEVRQEVPPDTARDFMSETTNPENVRGVKLLEIGLPAPLLAQGAVLIDTPGFGGLAPGYGGMTLAYLHSVDAVLFVSDASAPLARPEMDFLNRAVEACPAVLMVLSKTDLFPEWRRIAEIDAASLENADFEVPILPASSVLMAAGRTEGRSQLTAESGVPAIREIIEESILDPMKGLACDRGLSETRAALEQMIATAAEELAALEDPAASVARQAELQDRRAQLEHLRGPGSRWSQVLADGLSDSAGDAEHRFRSAMREVSRAVEDEIEKVDPGKAWDALSASLRERVGTATDELIASLHEGARTVEVSLLQLLQDSEGISLAPSLRNGLNARDLWAAKAIERPNLSSYAGTAFSGLRGGQGGITTISVVAGLAGVTLATAATAGIGLAFGGKQILDERKKQLQNRRQQARAAARQFVDDVQFEAGKRTRDLSRDIQRSLRDHFSARIAELQRGYTESLAAIQVALQKDQETRARLATTVRERGVQLNQLLAAVAEAEQAL